MAGRFASVIRSAVRGAHAHAAPAPAVSAEVSALRVKEAGSWKNLSAEEKRQIYRATYGQSKAEIQAGDKSETGKIVLGVAICVSAGVLLGKLLNAGLAQPQPKTMSPEWKAAELKQVKERGLNPVHGFGGK